MVRSKQCNEFSTEFKDHLPDQLFIPNAHLDQVMTWPDAEAFAAAAASKSASFNAFFFSL